LQRGNKVAMPSTLAGSAGNSGSSDGIGAAAQFFNPTDVVADGAGGLYIADGNSTLRRVALADRSVITIAGRAFQARVTLGPLPAGLNRPTAVALLPTGEIIIADATENAVLIVGLD